MYIADMRRPFTMHRAGAVQRRPIRVRAARHLHPGQPASPGAIRGELGCDGAPIWLRSLVLGAPGAVPRMLTSTKGAVATAASD